MIEQPKTWTPSETVITDTVGVSLIAGVLVALHVVLPPGVRAQLAFDHEAVHVWTLWTHAYVHTGWPHLLQNVAGYLSAAAAAYLLCRLLDTRQWFWWTAVAFLLVLPPLVGLSSYTIIRWIAPAATVVEWGFSGVVAGFAGFVFVAFVVWIIQQAGKAVAQAVGQALVLVLLWVVSVIYSRGIDIRVTGLVLVGLGLSAGLVLYDRQLSTIPSKAADALPQLQFGVSVIILVVAFVVGLFPADIVSGGTTTNIFAHGAGLVWGAILSGGLWYSHDSSGETSRWRGTLSAFGRGDGR